MLHRFFLAVFGIVFVCPLLADNNEDFSQYFAVMIDGKKIGHSHTTRKYSAQRVETSENLVITIQRAGMSMTVETVETTVETIDGDPVAFASVQDINGMKQTTTGQIGPDGKMTVSITSMGTNQRKVMDYPKGALMAEGLRQKHAKTNLKQGQTGSAVFFSPSMLAGIKASWTIGPMKEIDLFGRVLKLREIESVLYPATGTVRSISYVDDQANALKMEIPLMGMKMELIGCTEEVAKSSNQPFDFLEKSIVKSPKSLASLSDGSAVTYIIKPADESAISIIQTDSQHVKRKKNGIYMVTVKPLDPGRGDLPYKGRDPQILKHLRPNRYLQSDDKKVKALAVEATKDSKTAFDAVKDVEKFVSEFISAKDLSVGYATAAEVAETAAGDCSEHALLAAAMLRAVGVPSRVATGITYTPFFSGIDDAFVGHAWAQGYVDGKWVNLDAARLPYGGYGPGHITLAAGDGDPADFFSIINTLGYFKIVDVKIKKP
jgi:transglutaminase-like putative cysteine protease